jgi:hypothetical protein
MKEQKLKAFLKRQDKIMNIKMQERSDEYKRIEMNKKLLDAN